MRSWMLRAHELLFKALSYSFLTKSSLGCLHSGHTKSAGSSSPSYIYPHTVQRQPVFFSWPGLGQVTWDAVLSRNYPVIMGVCLLSAVVVLAANLITDILYALVDPTIQY